MTYQTQIFATKSEMLNELAVSLVWCIHDFLANQDKFRLVIGGGRTQEELNSRLVAIETPPVDWHRVLIYLSDERCVPLNHEKSNYCMNVNTLLKPLNLSLNHLIGYQTDLPPAKAATDYEESLSAIPRSGQDPLFDLSLLGLGADGHTASLFPGSPALNEQESLAAAAGPGPEGLQRVSLTYPALNASRKIWIMASGREKNGPVLRLLNGPFEPKTCPVQGIEPVTKDIALWLDRDSAQGINQQPDNHQ